jgi:hypothetical protein
MKHFLYVGFILLSSVCSAQKYVLIDKTMSLPITYSNTITTEDNFKGYFPVEKIKINEFINEIDKIARLLTDSSTKKPEAFKFNVGSTTFNGLKVPLAAEERLDVTLTTEYGTSKISMHLSDPKISNASNAYFINTWLKYLRSNLKRS